jgi:hypothetical protein
LWPAAKESEGQAAQMNWFGNNGIDIVNVPPPQHQHMKDVMGLNDPMLTVLGNNNNERMYALHYFYLRRNLCTA